MKNNTAPSAFLGIDVGKTDLFCHLLLPSEPVPARFDNNPEGGLDRLWELANEILFLHKALAPLIVPDDLGTVEEHITHDISWQSNQ